MVYTYGAYTISTTEENGKKTPEKKALSAWTAKKSLYGMCGSELCAIGKNRQFCEECDGSGLCAHGKRKFDCKDCGGGAYCEHGKLISWWRCTR